MFLPGDELNAANDLWKQLPEDLRSAAEEKLTPGETPLVWFELDLDADLHYARGLLVLTDRRLIEVGPVEIRESRERPTKELISVRSIPLDTFTGLCARELGNTGILELLGTEKLLCHWRYTIGRASLAHRFVSRYERLRKGDLSSNGEEPEGTPTTVCPSCGEISLRVNSFVPTVDRPRTNRSPARFSG